MEQDGGERSGEQAHTLLGLFAEDFALAFIFFPPLLLYFSTLLSHPVFIYFPFFCCHVSFLSRRMWRQHFPGKQHDFCFLFWTSNKVWHVGGGREVGGWGGSEGVQMSVCCVVVEVSK